MKTKIISSGFFLFMSTVFVFAQDRTIVNAYNSEISDNLDLRAVASLFGEARDLNDFERQLNDPTIQISNLDLNNDNQVDYLRVIESVEKNTHLIIIQSVLGQDMYQDVATIEVEKDRNNRVQVQVVGDVYMYGENYIYEPVYVRTPVIYRHFWVRNYRPYYSTWYWNYYPSYYYVWNPYPIFRYRTNVNVFINFDNHYNYVNYRNCHRAAVIHQSVRQNYCERNYPNRSFSQRNRNVVNRYELDQSRGYRNASSRNELAYNGSRNPSTRVYSRTNTNSYNSNDTRQADDHRIASSNSRERNIQKNENNPRVFSTSEPSRQYKPSYERSNSNDPRDVNRRNDNRSSANTQYQNESPRTNSEIRTRPNRENQQARVTSAQESRGRGNSRR